MLLATTIDGDTGMVVKRLSVPVGLEELMESLTKQVLMKKPKDLFAFASEHFAHLVAIRETLNANQQEQDPGDTKQLKVKSVTSGTKFNKLPTPIIFTNSKTPRSITTPKSFRSDEKKKTRFNQQSLIKDPSPRRGVTTQKERAKWKKQTPLQKEEVAPPKRTPREIREAYTFRRDDSKHRSKERSVKSDKTDEKNVGKSPTKVDLTKTRREPTRRQQGQGVTPRITPRNKSTDSNSSSSISIHGKGISKSTEKLPKLPKGKNVAKVAPIAVGAVGAVGAAMAGGALSRSKGSKSSQESEDHESDLKRIDSTTVSESGILSDRSDKSKSSHESEGGKDSEELDGTGPKEEAAQGREVEEDVESVSGSIVSNAVVGSTLSEDLEGPTENATDIAAPELTIDEDKGKEEVEEEPKLETIPEAKSTEPEVKDEARIETPENLNKEEDGEDVTASKDLKVAEGRLGEDQREVHEGSTKIEEAVDLTGKHKDVNNEEAVDQPVKDILVSADKHEEEVKKVLFADEIPAEATSEQAGEVSPDVSVKEENLEAKPEEIDNKEEVIEEVPLTVDGKPMTVSEEELYTVVDSEEATPISGEEVEEVEQHKREEAGELKHAAEVVEEQLRVLKEMEEKDDTDDKEFAKQEKVSQEEENESDSKSKEDHVKEAKDTDHKVSVDTPQGPIEEDADIKPETEVNVKENDQESEASESVLRISQSAPNLIPSPVDGDDHEDDEDAGLVTIAKTPSPEDTVPPESDTSEHPAAKVEDDGPLSLEDVSKYLNQEKQKNDSPLPEQESLECTEIVEDNAGGSKTERPTTSVVFGGDVANAQKEEEVLAMHVQKSTNENAATKIQSVWRGHQTRKHVIKQIKKQVENTEKDVNDDGDEKVEVGGDDLENDEKAKAATVIQAFMKGHLVRKQINIARELKGINDGEEQLDVVKEENEEKFAKAATLIQAFIKGHLVRKNHKLLKKKQDGGEEVVKETDGKEVVEGKEQNQGGEYSTEAAANQNDEQGDVYMKLSDSIDKEINEVLEKLENVSVPDDEPDIHDRMKRSLDFSMDDIHDGDDENLNDTVPKHVAEHVDEALPELHDIQEENEEEPEVTDNEEGHNTSDHIAMTRSFVDNEKVNYVASPMPSPSEDGTTSGLPAQHGENEENFVSYIGMTSRFMENEKNNHVTSPMSSPRDDAINQNGGEGETVEADSNSKKEGKIAGALGAMGGYISSKTTGFKNFLSPRSKSTNKDVGEDGEQPMETPEDDQHSESIRISLTDDISEQILESPVPIVDEDITNKAKDSETTSSNDIAATKSFVEYEKENYESPRENLVDEVDTHVVKRNMMPSTDDTSESSKKDGKILAGAIGAVGGFIASQTNNLKTLISSGSKTLEEAKESMAKDAKELVEGDNIEGMELSEDPIKARFEKLRSGLDDMVDSAKENMVEGKNDFAEIVEKVSEDIEGAKNYIKDNVVEVVDESEGAFKAAEEKVEEKISDISDVVKGGQQDLVGNLDEVGMEINEKVSETAEEMKMKASNIKEEFTESITGADNVIEDKVKAVSVEVNEQVESVSEEIEILEDKANITISEVVNDLENKVTETVVGVENDIKNKLKITTDKINEEVKYVAEGIDKIGDKVDQTMTDAVGHVIKTTTGAENDIKGNLKDVSDEINEDMNSASEGIEEMGNKVDLGVSDIVNDMDITEVVDNLKDDATFLKTEVDDTIAGAKDEIKDNVDHASNELKRRKRGIDESIVDLEEDVNELKENVKNELKDNIDDTTQKLKAAVDEEGNKISETVSADERIANEAIADATTEMKDAVNDNIENITDKVHETEESINNDVVSLGDADAELEGDVDHHVTKAEEDITDIIEDESKKIEDIKDEVSDIVDNLKDNGKTAIVKVEDTIIQTHKHMKNDIQKTSEQIEDNIDSVPDKISEEIGNIDSAISESVRKVSESVIKAEDVITDNLEDLTHNVKESSEEISKNVDNLKEEIKDTITTSEEDIKSHIQEQKVSDEDHVAISEATNVVTAVEEDVKNNLLDITKNVKEIKEEGIEEVDSLKEDTRQIKEQIHDAGTDAEENIKDITKDVTESVDRVASPVDTATDNISDVNEAIMETREVIEDAVDDVDQGLKEAEEDISNTIANLKNDGNELVEQLNDTVDQLKDDISNTITEVHNVEKGAIDNIEDTVNGIAADVPEKVDKGAENVTEVIDQASHALSDDVSLIGDNITQELSSISDGAKDVGEEIERDNKENADGASKRGKRDVAAVLDHNLEQLNQELDKPFLKSVPEAITKDKGDIEEKVDKQFEGIAQKIHDTKETIKEKVSNIDPDEVVEVMDETADDIEKVTDLLNGEKEAPAEVVADIIETTGKIVEALDNQKIDATHISNAQDVHDNKIHVEKSSKTLKSPSFEETIQDFKDAIRNEIDDMEETDQSESPEEAQPDSLERIVPRAPPLSAIAPGTATSIEEEEPPEVMSKEPIVERPASEGEQEHEPHVDILIIDEEYSSPLEIFDEEEEAREEEEEDEHDRDHLESRQLIHEIKEELNNIKAIIEEGDEVEQNDDHQKEDLQDRVVITEITEEEEPSDSERKHDGDNGDVEVLNKDTLEIHNNAINTMGRMISHDSSTSLDSLATVVLTEDLNKYKQQIEEKNKENNAQTNDNEADGFNKEMEESTKKDSAENHECLDLDKMADGNIKEEDIENESKTLDENANQDDVIIIDATQLSNSNEEDIKFLAGFVNAATKIQSAFRGFRVRNLRANKDKENEDLTTTDDKADPGYSPHLQESERVEEEKVQDTGTEALAEVVERPETAEKKNPTLGQFLKSLTTKQDESNHQIEETETHLEPEVNKVDDVSELVKAVKNGDECDDGDLPVSPSAEPFFLHDPAVVKDNPIADAIKMSSDKTNQEANIGLLHSGEFHDAIPLPFEANDLYEKSQTNLEENDAQRAPNVNDAKATPPAGAERPVTTSASTSSDVVAAASATTSASASLSATSTAAATPHPIRPAHADHSVTTALLSDDDAQRTAQQQDLHSQSHTDNASGSETQSDKEEEAEEVESTEREADISSAAADETVEGEDTLPEVDATQSEGAGDAMDPRRNNATIIERNAESQAATKIQASFRGYQVRKQMSKPKNCIDVISPKRNARRKTSGGRAPDSKKLKDDIDIEDKSATKIQAGIRGFLVRRRNQKKRDNEEV